MSVATDRQALVRAVVESPLDPTPRLVLADWLDERHNAGADPRAELIRVMCRLADEYPAHLHAPEKAGEAWHSLEGCPACRLLKRQAELLVSIYPKGWLRLPVLAADGPGWAVAGRSYLWTIVCAVEQWRSPWPFAPANHFGDILAYGTARRGFVEKVQIRLDAWMAHGAKLVSAQPVAEVVATDREPETLTVLTNRWAPVLTSRWVFGDYGRPAALASGQTVDPLPHWIPQSLRPFAGPRRRKRVYEVPGGDHHAIVFGSEGEAKAWLSEALVDHARMAVGMRPLYGPVDPP